MGEKVNRLVSVIMGSTSDLGVMRDALGALEEFGLGYEVHALSAHRTPRLVQEYAAGARDRGIRVIIAAAGGAAHLPGVIASYTTLPVIGVPILSSNSPGGLDAILAILQMPAGIPVATVALNGARNAAILAAEILGTSDAGLRMRLEAFKEGMAAKVRRADEGLQEEFGVGGEV